MEISWVNIHFRKSVAHYIGLIDVSDIYFYNFIVTNVLI